MKPGGGFKRSGAAATFMHQYSVNAPVARLTESQDIA